MKTFIGAENSYDPIDDLFTLYFHVKDDNEKTYRCSCRVRGVYTSLDRLKIIETWSKVKDFLGESFKKKD